MAHVVKHVLCLPAHIPLYLFIQLEAQTYKMFVNTDGCRNIAQAGAMYINCIGIQKIHK